MQRISAKVNPAGGAGERITIGGSTLPFSLHQLDTPSTENVNRRKNSHTKSADHPLDGHDQNIACARPFEGIDQCVYPLFIDNRMDSDKIFR